VQAVSALERGYRKAPYPKTIERLADALSLSAEARAALDGAARRARSSRLIEAPPRATNLPRQLTSFVGREEVVKEIVELVETTPLVSVVGTGGAGKTRAAIEAAALMVNEFSHGVWFVELAPLNDPALVLHALATALGVQESPQRPLLDTLIAYLEQKQLLIILDNCEHVITQARRVAGSLLRECGRISLITTSREALTIAGERVYRMPPLGVPDRNDVAPDEALAWGAVALFADRARSADARFAVTNENVATIVQICRRLDGLPLALELAAARTTILSPRQILERLDRVFDLLIAEGEPVLHRHQTMRAAIDWSYSLLSASSRLLFERLAIFAAGFSLENAAAVCCDAALSSDDIFELLSTLVTRSLVMVDFKRGDARYHLLEATRQYALERLGERGERPMLAQRHARACLALAERLDREWYGARERVWFDEARGELDESRAALQWALSEEHDQQTGRRLAAALGRIWYSLSPVEGRRWVRAAIKTIDEKTPEAEVAWLYLTEAELCGALGEYKASLNAAERALRILARLEDPLQTARAKQAAGSALGALSRASEGEALLHQALKAARALDNRRLQALALGDLGTLRSRGRDIEAARRFYAEALAGYVTLGLERPAASIAGHLAEVEFAAGNATGALQRAEEARVGHEATQNRRSVANDLTNMAAYLTALDCYDDALVHAKDAVLANRDVQGTVLTAFALQHVAAVGALRDRSEDAAALLGFVDARLTALEAPREYTEQQEYERMLRALRAAFGEEELRELMARGAEWIEDGAVNVALSSFG
jgi:predicted ATPase